MDAVKIIEEINTQRDRNLHAKLDELKYEILEKVDVSINKRMQHLNSSPTTIEKFNKVDVLCAQRGEQIISMKDDITDIKEALKGISSKLDEALAGKVDKDNFEFWRNILVFGVLLSIFGGVITILLGYFVK